MTSNASNTLGRRAIEALPDNVRVGGFDFRIEKWTSHQAAGAHRYGEFSSIEQTIRLQIDMPSAYKAVDTVLHEFCHAMFWTYGVNDEDKEERIVGAMGSGWMALHRDNPWLAKWITESLS
jgi:hypothetical protein